MKNKYAIINYYGKTVCKRTTLEDLVAGDHVMINHGTEPRIGTFEYYEDNFKELREYLSDIVEDVIAVEQITEGSSIKIDPKDTYECYLLIKGDGSDKLYLKNIFTGFKHSLIDILNLMIMTKFDSILIKKNKSKKFITVELSEVFSNITNVVNKKDTIIRFNKDNGMSFQIKMSYKYNISGIASEDAMVIDDFSNDIIDPEYNTNLIHRDLIGSILYGERRSIYKPSIIKKNFLNRLFRYNIDDGYSIDTTFDPNRNCYNSQNYTLIIENIDDDSIISAVAVLDRKIDSCIYQYKISKYDVVRFK